MYGSLSRSHAGKGVGVYMQAGGSDCVGNICCQQRMRMCAHAADASLKLTTVCIPCSNADAALLALYGDMALTADVDEVWKQECQHTNACMSAQTYSMCNRADLMHGIMAVHEGHDYIVKLEGLPREISEVIHHTTGCIGL